MSTNSIEAPGGGRLYHAPDTTWFLLGQDDQPNITRYEVGADGKFVKGATISLTDYGVTELADQAVIFVDDHKAYYMDGFQNQLVIIDPTEMTITGKVDIPGTEREGFVASLGYALTREDAIYVPVNWYEPVNYNAVPGGSMLVRIDPKTDTVTATEPDARCNGAVNNDRMVSDDGTAYFFSTRENSVVWRSVNDGKSGIHDCALRMKKGQQNFDPDWFLDLTTRTGGYPALSHGAAGDSKVFLMVLDETITPVVNEGAGLEWPFFLSQEGWVWYVLDLESDEDAVRMDVRPPSILSRGTFTLDGRSIALERNADRSVSSLFEVTPVTFEFAALAKMPGNLFVLDRMRK